ncbi:homoserine dehydrogenase [Natronincola peptidivorans]|uniref:Homoserine dehydrogenase n=1 Tax=Natronincola peptidivorans TaxID=426128 RepID=A0A1I0EXG6_9FIRM|nr:homoserine dehydrogenase [Natronincola peptidivorans]SET50209.1 homoserine dehydrogenase [Natronincola peptidivorans]
MKIAIIGFGGVGKAFFQLLRKKKKELMLEGLDIKLIYILKSNGGIYDPEGIDYEDLTVFLENQSDISQYRRGGSKKANFQLLIENHDIDVLIEMTPTNKKTAEPAMTYIKWALANGKHVITANKGPVLLAYKQLNLLAAQNNVQFCIGCTAGGALPTINGGLIDMAGSQITSIEGILNGTTNFILQEMEEKNISYELALKTAQHLGIAETDPTLDVEGWDTATKLLILTNVLMNQEKELEDIKVEGITRITLESVKKAIEEGKKYKLIGKATNKNNKIELTVQLEILDNHHPLFNVNGKNKGVRYASDTLGDLTIIGGASGVIPAAASILRDLIIIHRGYHFSR